MRVRDSDADREQRFAEMRERVEARRLRGDMNLGRKPGAGGYVRFIKTKDTRRFTVLADGTVNKPKLARVTLPTTRDWIVAYMLDRARIPAARVPAIHRR